MLFVRDVMTRKVLTVKQDETVGGAARKMVRQGVGCLVVVKGTNPVGIITEGDVSRAIAKGADPWTVPVRSVGGKRLVTTDPDTRVEEAAKLMSDAKVKKLPVTDGGKLVGIVTQTDIVASSFDLVTSLKEMVVARYRPPDFAP
jgi:CBS domain-containing protein